MDNVLLSSKNMCWCTPQDFFDALNEEFCFVLDPSATEKTAKCKLYYTPETDGLSQAGIAAELYSAIRLTDARSASG